MITFERVSHGWPGHGGQVDILRDVDAVFDSGRTIGILGGRGVGKSTLIRLISREIPPTGGRIRSAGRISWPMASIHPLLSQLSLRSNARFAAQLNRADSAGVIGRMAEIGELRPYLDVAVNRLPRELQVRAAYALCLALGFDTYVADERLFMGDPEFQTRSQRYVEDMRGRHTFIIATRYPAIVRRYCDLAYVLSAATLTRYEDPNEAAQAFQGT